jgi:hypothetical protein
VEAERAYAFILNALFVVLDSNLAPRFDRLTEGNSRPAGNLKFVAHTTRRTPRLPDATMPLRAA